MHARRPAASVLCVNMHVLQHDGALVVVVECVCSDEALWRQRLEQRGQQDASSERAHKPDSWEQLQQLLQG